MRNYHPTLHLVIISAYTKLDQLQSIHSQDIEQKHNSDNQSRAIALSKMNETKCAIVFT